jgi:hypothetical protein
LYHLIEHKPDLKTIKNFFNITAHDYWKTHFKFDSESEESSKPMGDTAFHSIVINTIVPYLFFMSKHNLNSDYIDYALDLLIQLPAEVNTKTIEFTKLGVKAQNALESQAQIHLLDTLCSKKACLRCNVAEFLLKSSV